MSRRLIQIRSIFSGNKFACSVSLDLLMWSCGVIAPVFNSKVLCLKKKKYRRSNDSSYQSMGWEKEIISPGDGATYPKVGQMVVIHYTACLTDGKMIDSSRGRGNPFKFRIGKGEVIKGWDEGVSQMSRGERAKLTCSPEFAYGSRGYPGAIPNNATLVFDIELLRLE